MPTVKIFTQSGCARCPQARQAGTALMEEGFDVMEFDIGTAEGLAEAAFHSVQATPTILIEDANEEIIGDFRGEVPPLAKLREILGRG